MKSKRITMKDVAKEAGVSTATVSYVLNYSDTERISHATRMRVFEAVNKLQYVPNMTAKSLTSKRTFLIGIIINMEEHNKKSKLYQYYDLSGEIQKRMNALGYDVFLIPTKEVSHDILISRRRSLDAIFVMDMKEELLKGIANNFFVPAIFIDGYVDDPLFCKIMTDTKGILKKAHEYLGDSFYVVMEDYSSKNMLAAIQEQVKEEDIFINRVGNSLIEFLQMHKNGKGLVIGEILGMQVENYVDNRNLAVVVHSQNDIMLLSDTKVIVVSNKEKACKAVEIMNKLLHIEKSKEVEEVTYVEAQ